MSTPPPPFPPSNQPPSFTPPPGAVGAPSWQTGGGGSLPGLEPASAPTSKSKAPLVIGVLVVVIGLVVAAVFLFSGDDDSGGGGVNSAAAGRGLEAVLRDASFNDNGFEELDDCPFGELDGLVTKVTEVIDVDETVLDGDTSIYLTEETDLPGYADCQIYEVDEDGEAGQASLYFQAISDPPRDYEEYIKEFAGDSSTLDFEDSVEYRGGEVFLYCAEAVDEGGFTGCDADWVSTDDSIALNVFVGGERMKTEDAFTALKAVIDTMAEALAEFDVNES